MIDLERCLAFRVKVSVAFQLVKLADQNLEESISISAETRSITNPHLLTGSWKLHRRKLALIVSFKGGAERRDDILALGGQGLHVCSGIEFSTG
jgi:hypothetical protein